jgi:hypothetical protein
MDLAIADLAGKPHRLFRNIPGEQGGRTFEDVSAGSGIDDEDGSAREHGGVIAADYDNDGDPDLYFRGFLPADSSYGLLYRNDGGGTFTNVSIESGVRRSGDILEGEAWTDFDHDGLVDLLTVNIAGSGRAIRLLRNTGGAFIDASDLTPALPIPGHFYTVAMADYDLDGWSDAILTPNSTAPVLLRNIPDGHGGRRFVDIAAAAGYTHLGPAPMGIAAGDCDGDGDIDFAITDADVGTYYLNNGDGTLSLWTPFETFFGWGTAWLDADNDGDLDNYQAGSWGNANADRLHANLGNGQWLDASAALNALVVASQYTVQADYNNDGRADLITVNPNDFISIYENISSAPHHWATVRLVGGHGVNSDAIGAVIRLTAGGRTQVREVISGSSTGSTEDLRRHFGLGAAAQIDHVEVMWPRSGGLAWRTSTLHGPLPVDTLLTIAAPCPADLDRDGSPTLFDFLTFLNRFAEASPLADADISTGEGVLDLFDFLAFQNAFAAGCQ